MSAKIDFLYLSEPDMIKAGVKDMGKCVEVMEDMMVTLKKGDYVMGGENHNSHGCMVTFPENFRACRRMRMTDVSWQCRHIWEAISRWQV